MSRNTLSDYIVGNRPAPKDCLRKIADFLGCDIEDFHYTQALGNPRTSSPTAQATTPHVQAEEVLTGPALSDRKQADHCTLVPTLHRAVLDRVQIRSCLYPQEHPAEIASVDSATWFGLKLAQLMTLVVYWNGQVIGYGELQAVIDQEIHMFDALRPQYPIEDYTLSRRQALIAIAALPIALLIAVYQRQDSALVIREFLSRCAASLAACRHLLNGRELEAVESVLPQYVPTLVMLAQRPSQHQEAAARLAVQADHLRAILALHRNNLAAMEMHSREAVTYSRLTGDRILYVYALKRVVGALRYQKRPTEMLEIYQEMLPSLHEVPPQLRGIVYTDLAWAYGHSKQEQESLRHLGLAHEAYAADTGDDQTLLDVGLPVLYLHEGFTRLALHEHYPDHRHDQEAWKTFANVSGASLPLVVPERIRIEAINNLALTALALGNLEQFCDLLEQGVSGAKMLGSQKRRQEAIDAYWKGREQWPNEARVRDLGDLFVN
jgi:tetratricopeptide (TPR) repeat protein